MSKVIHVDFERNKRPQLVNLHDVLSLLDADRFLDKRQSAEFCGVGIRTLESWPIPKYRPSGKVLYRKRELIAFLEAHREIPTQPEVNIDAIADDVVRRVLG
jgi:hypothetical protein